MIKQQIGQLLEKEVDRRDFLKHIGVAIVAVAGVSTVLSNLTALQNKGSRGASVDTNSQSGYGLSAYGR